MKNAERDREDFEFLMATAREGRAQGLSHFLHLDQPVGIWNYIRIANEIAASAPPGRLLDWGCGMGQMTWLLRRRGYDVVAFDIGQTVDGLPDIPLTREVRPVRSSSATTLPFDDASFDVVLSCGVLEHVDEYSQKPGNELRSLREIRRILRPGGWFPIYQLPQRLAWQESITRTFRIGYFHPRRFTEREIRSLLLSTGFRVERLRRYNMLPKNLTGLPMPLRDLYSMLAQPIHVADRVLSTVPIVNRVAGVLELTARPV